jgi:hypothetical protein
MKFPICDDWLGLRTAPARALGRRTRLRLRRSRDSLLALQGPGRWEGAPHAEGFKSTVVGAIELVGPV